MSNHPRTDIRKAIAALIDAVSEFQDVVTSRVHAFQERDLPAVAVYTISEQASRDTTAPKLRRDLSVYVDIHLQAGTHLDDHADKFALLVEAALAADPKLGGKCLDSRLTATNIGMNGEGERRTGLCRLTYTYSYRTLPNGTAA